MTALPARRENESQTGWLRRALRETGRVAHHAALYEARYVDGTRWSFTTLTQRVEDLRRAGWVITTEGADGLCTYVLVSEPVGRPKGQPRPLTPPAPSEARVSPVHAGEARPSDWACTDCGSPPAMEPTPLLGGMARTRCLTCGTQRLFRRVA